MGRLSCQLLVMMSAAATLDPDAASHHHTGRPIQRRLPQPGGTLEGRVNISDTDGARRRRRTLAAARTSARASFPTRVIA